jgi:hypothetical protein
MNRRTSPWFVQRSAKTRETRDFDRVMQAEAATKSPQKFTKMTKITVLYKRVS